METVTDVVYDAKISAYASSAMILKEYADIFILSNEDVVLPTSIDEGVILDIKAISDGDFILDSFGKPYDLDNSYVVVSYDGYQYVFYITLQSGVGNKGVIAIDSTILSSNSVYNIEEEHNFLSNISLNNDLLIEEENKIITIKSICLKENNEVVCKNLN